MTIYSSISIFKCPSCKNMIRVDKEGQNLSERFSHKTFNCPFCGVNLGWRKISRVSFLYGFIILIAGTVSVLVLPFYSGLVTLSPLIISSLFIVFGALTNRLVIVNK